MQPDWARKQWGGIRNSDRVPFPDRGFSLVFFSLCYLESVEDFREESGPVLPVGREDEPRVLVAVAAGDDVGASAHLGLEL